MRSMGTTQIQARPQKEPNYVKFDSAGGNCPSSDPYLDGLLLILFSASRHIQRKSSASSSLSLHPDDLFRVEE
jgi:hypothetical protein